ncbi:hypothetical protein SBRY_70001 [Actinacidiphila bryophytorum]|uniref:Uncharacterized protein n=1 Tax=Actinacidiphila bryophytorum TaxID=1436133 RepID=A0A9W4H6R0_9ACTN|nr:hypothetical protein SBRY_70001 [Actinacidiphila bryophytorum]
MQAHRKGLDLKGLGELRDRPTTGRKVRAHRKGQSPGSGGTLGGGELTGGT